MHVHVNSDNLSDAVEDNVDAETTTNTLSSNPTQLSSNVTILEHHRG